MNFPQFLVISDTPAKPDAHGLYKAIVNGPQYFEIGGAVPIIDTARQQCLGIAKITEIHVGMKFTLVFYQSCFVSNPKALYKSYEAIIRCADGRIPDGTPRRAQYDSGASTMDPAMAMSMGMGRTPRESAGEDDDDISLADAMRMAGNDPDDFWD